jgi:hypothetical protein
VRVLVLFPGGGGGEANVRTARCGGGIHRSTVPQASAGQLIRGQSAVCVALKVRVLSILYYGCLQCSASNICLRAQRVPSEKSRKTGKEYENGILNFHGGYY